MEPLRSHTSGLRDTTWPAPAADLWRTGSAVDAGLPTGVNSADLATATAEVPPAPFFGITYDDETVFVLGGSPFMLELFTDAYLGNTPHTGLAAMADVVAKAITHYVKTDSVLPSVSRIDTATMKVRTLKLPKGPSINYVGGLVAHENGKLYVVATSTLFEIDPETLTITRSVSLPLLHADHFFTTFFTTYNGLQVSPRNGDIILKMADFSGRTTTGLMISVDTSDLSIRTQSEVKAGTSRMSVALQGETEYVYLPGPTETLRYVVSDDGFTLDEAWAETYRTRGDGSTQGPAMAYMGDYDTVVFSSNDTIIYGVTEPLKIYAKSTADTTQPLKSRQAVSAPKPGGTFSGVSGDPFKSGIFIAQDAINGVVAGWQLGRDGSLRRIWERDQYLMSAGPAVAADRGHVYMDHRRCDDGGKDCAFFLIVLDLETGAELARTKVAATLPTVGHIFVGRDDVFYIATEAGKDKGLVTRVSVR